MWCPRKWPLQFCYQSCTEKATRIYIYQIDTSQSDTGDTSQRCTSGSDTWLYALASMTLSDTTQCTSHRVIRRVIRREMRPTTISTWTLRHVGGSFWENDTWKRNSTEWHEQCLTCTGHYSNHSCFLLDIYFQIHTRYTVSKSYKNINIYKDNMFTIIQCNTLYFVQYLYNMCMQLQYR